MKPKLPSKSTSKALALSRSQRDDVSVTNQTWWMVDLESNFPPQRNAAALLARCMRIYGWDEDKGQRILESYRQFLVLKKKYQDWDASLLTPCVLIDQMWQQHILDVLHYTKDMVLLCGHVVGRNLDEDLDIEGKEQKLDETREALKKVFAEKYDEEIWESTSAEDLEQKGERKAELLVDEEEREEDHNQKGTVAKQNKKRKQEKESSRDDSRVSKRDTRKAKKRKHTSDSESTKPKKKKRQTAKGDLNDSGQPTVSALQSHFDAEPVEPSKKNRTSSSEVVLHRFRQLRSGGEPVNLVINATNAETSKNEFTHHVEFGCRMQLDKVMDWYKNDVFPFRKYWIIQITHSGKDLETSNTAEQLKLKNGDVINIKVVSSLKICIRDETGERTNFNISKMETFESIFNSYAERKGVETNKLRFCWRGKLLQGSESPSSLGLEENDDIYCMVEHVQKEDVLQIFVRDEAERLTRFEIEERSQLSEIFYSYAAKKRLLMNEIRFYSNGEVLFGHNTPQTAELKSFDVIDCVKEQPRTLKISIIDHAGEEVFFKIRKRAKFELMFSTYRRTTKKSAEDDELRFLFNGDLIDKDSTPLALGLKDGDKIFAQSKHDPITICVRDQTGERTFFKVKETTSFDKICSAYASSKGVKTNSLRFLTAGEVIGDDDTPLSLGLNDEDEIHVQPVLGLKVTIILRDPTEGAVFYKLGQRTKLKVLFSAHAKRRSVRADSLRFLLKGDEILEDDTPLSLGLVEEDEIHVVSKKMNIVVKDETEKMTHFKVRETTSLAKVFSVYAAREGVETGDLHFHHAGQIVDSRHTPLSLGLEDDDEILASKCVPITIIVKDELGKRMFFKVRKTVTLARVFSTYSEREGVTSDSLYFHRDGELINEYDTVLSLGLEDGEEILACTRDPITIIVIDQDLNEVFFKVKKTTLLAKVMRNYARRYGTDVSFLRCHTFTGKEIRGHETPLSLGLEDEDAVYVFNILSLLDD